MAYDANLHNGFGFLESASKGVCWLCRTDACGPRTVHLGTIDYEGLVVVGERCIGELAHLVGFTPLSTAAKQAEEMAELRTQLAEARAEAADAREEAAQATGLLAAKFAAASA